MGKDNIKDQLKQRPKQVRKTIDDTVNTTVSGKKGSLRDITKISNPVDSSVAGDASLAQIEKVVERVNYGQQELEKLKRMQDFPGYRIAVNTWDTMQGWVGKKPIRAKDQFQLFEYQQNNVRELNNLLAGMTATYSDDVEFTRSALDEILKTTSKEAVKRGDYEKKVIPPALKRFEDISEKLKTIDREKNPEEYYEAFQEYVNAKREGRKTRFEYVVTSVSEKHHKEQIQNLELQEELFETMLYGVMNMAVQTNLYQDTLDKNIRIWKPIGDIAQAVSSVSDGVQVLAQFNYLLNQSYIDTVRNVAAIIDNHPGTRMVTDTNNDLRDLVHDINNSQYRQAEDAMR